MHNLDPKQTERVRKQFLRLCEWTLVPQPLEEDDDTEDPQNDEGAGDSAAEQTPEQGNEELDTDQPQGEDANMSDTPNSPNLDMPDSNSQMDQMASPNGNNMPNVNMDQEGPVGMENVDGDNEVIDVDDLTNAQEKMNAKVNKVGRNVGGLDDKMNNISNILQQMIDIINHNNDEIKQFKQEFEKRNPTQKEKLELRSLDSAPYSMSPTEYWDRKVNTDRNQYAPTEYTLTQKDVDDFNPSDIEKSFYIEDDLKQDINKIFGYR